MSSLRELPVFPLPEVVLFPGSPLPLHIFEYRYRMMMASVLETDKRFGVLMWNPQEGRPATVGCCAEILRYERLPDGRMMILTVGQQRFQVLRYRREKPFRVALVEWIEDEPPTEDVHALAMEVKQLLQDVVYLSAKLTDQQIDLPDKYPTLPREFSYWVASNFHGAPLEQQALLEMQDTAGRLRRESEILASTRSHLAARTALKEAFKDQAEPNR